MTERGNSECGCRRSHNTFLTLASYMSSTTDKTTTPAFWIHKMTCPQCPGRLSPEQLPYLSPRYWGGGISAWDEELFPGPWELRRDVAMLLMNQVMSGRFLVASEGRAGWHLLSRAGACRARCFTCLTDPPSSEHSQCESPLWAPRSDFSFVATFTVRINSSLPTLVQVLFFASPHC